MGALRKSGADLKGMSVGAQRGMAKRRPPSYMGRMMRKPIGLAVLVALFAVPAHAGQFPWEPAQPVAPPPLNSVQPKTPEFKTPPINAPTKPVPGHESSYGYVPGYQSDGPVPIIAPGRKSQGWVPGYHDSNGAWVPGHPQ
jgi:hypothetical protein